MVFFNHATRQMTAKIVYYGPGLCGKTTNLNTIYGKTSQKARGEMVSLNTETDRTLFFDLLPMDVGVIGGFKTKLQLYTVPGQVFYNSTRKLVLKGVDGIVFVADSQVPMLDANKESLQNLEANLRELGLHLHDIPMVFQWNKRDLKHIVPVETLERELNPGGAPSFQSNAQEGTGVFETLRGITKLALTHIKSHHLGESNPAREEQPKLAGTPVPVLPPTPVKPLAISDLPSVTEMLGDASLLPPPIPVRKLPIPIRVSTPTALAAPRPVALPAPVVPVRLGALSRPAVSPMTISLAAPPAPRLKAPAPRPAAMPLVGDLMPMAQPGPVKVDLSSVADGGDLEISIQVRQGGRLVGEGQAVRSTPAAGGSAKLTLELKRG